MKKLLTLALSLALTAAVGVASANTKLVVGASATPHAEILEAAKPILAEKGIDLEIVGFDDYVQPNLQLEAGDLDANYFQHIPYLENFNADNGTHLVSAGAVHYEPMGLYVNPAKAIALDSIPDGATIAIPNDPTNESRALGLLEFNGLLTLEDTKDQKATVLNIAENPHKFDFVEVEAAQVPRTLADVDLGVINSNYALQAGTDVVGTPIAYESTEVAYPNIIAVREGDDREYLQGGQDIHEASLALQQAVRSVYLEAAAKDPALRVVDCSDPAGAMDSPEGIFAKICAQLAPILEADAEVQGL